MAQPPQTSEANSRINGYFERVAIWACSAMIGFGLLVFQDHRAQLVKMEEKVQHLYVDKVSRQELKEEINRVVQSQEATKSDILARLDLFFEAIKSSRQNK